MVKELQNFNLPEPQRNQIFCQFNNDQYCTWWIGPSSLCRTRPAVAVVCGEHTPYTLSEHPATCQSPATHKSSMCTYVMKLLETHTNKSQRGHVIWFYFVCLVYGLNLKQNYKLPACNFNIQTSKGKQVNLSQLTL